MGVNATVEERRGLRLDLLQVTWGTRLSALGEQKGDETEFGAESELQGHRLWTLSGSGVGRESRTSNALAEYLGVPPVRGPWNW